MRKNFWKLAAVVTVMVMVMVMSVYARERKQDTAGWWYEDSDGAYLIGQWGWIDGKCCYLGTSGYMLTNGMAPDGSTVNKRGEWAVDGVVQAKGDGTDSNGSTVNEQYPLKERVGSNFAQGSNGTTGWKWDAMYTPWNLSQDEMYAMNHAIQDRNSSYLSSYRGLNITVLTGLAGHPATSLDYVD